MASFTIENLTFSYPNSSRPALENLNLSIPQGEITLLCGASGSGKSTLLRHLKTCLTPHGKTQGQVLFGGQPLSQLSPAEQARKIGFVMQHPDDQIVTDKVYHELAFGLESLGCSQQTMRLRVAEMASYFGISSWFRQDVNTLSGGQKQLMNLASVTAMSPEVLILDEPTSQLDPIAASDFLHTLQKLNEDLGLTILLSEHRLEEALAMAEWVAVLDDGKLVTMDRPRKAVAQVQHHPIFQAMPTPVQVFYALHGQGEAPLTVKEGQKFLENYPQTHPLPPKPSEKKEKKQPIFQLEECWFRYERNGPDILQGLSLSLHPGEIYGLVGGNGAGKTTALGILSGELTPYRGKLLLDGKKLGAIHSAQHGIAALPQDPRCLFVASTVALELRDASQDEADIAAIAKQLQLESLLSMHPYDLSGGEQQRVALAKVLLQHPRVLLLDEPTKGMDAEFKQHFGQLLQSLARQGAAICLVSHDIEFCAQYAHRCGLLFQGQMVTENPPREFFSGNHFYTTAANRMARFRLPQAVLCQEVIQCLEN